MKMSMPMKVKVKFYKDKTRRNVIATRPDSMTCVVSGVTPKMISMIESQYRQIPVTVRRDTGIEYGGSICGYRISKRDLEKINRAADLGLLDVYFSWMGGAYRVKPSLAYEMVLKVLKNWKSENLGVNLKDYGSKVTRVPKGALVFEADCYLGSKAFWESAERQLSKL